MSTRGSFDKYLGRKTIKVKRETKRIPNENKQRMRHNRKQFEKDWLCLERIMLLQRRSRSMTHFHAPMMPVQVHMDRQQTEPKK